VQHGLRRFVDDDRSLVYSETVSLFAAVRVLSGGCRGKKHLLHPGAIGINRLLPGMVSRADDEA
jgi:hypothetical protein